MEWPEWLDAHFKADDRHDSFVSFGRGGSWLRGGPIKVSECLGAKGGGATVFVQELIVAWKPVVNDLANLGDGGRAGKINVVELSRRE